MPSATAMNLLILMDDQHRHDALCCAAAGVGTGARTWLTGQDATIVQTPLLGQLAASGVRFSQAVANLPVCVPRRHSFITGLYPHQIGILSNQRYWPDQPPVPTLGQPLGHASFATAAIGKMHWKNRTSPDQHVPDKRGFAFRAGRGGKSDGPVDVSLANQPRVGDRAWQQAAIARLGVGGKSREGYVGDVVPVPGALLPEAWLADQAVAYLQDHRQQRGEQPFCMLVSLDLPHPPNVVPADYADRYDPQRVPLAPPPHRTSPRTTTCSAAPFGVAPGTRWTSGSCASPSPVTSRTSPTSTTASVTC